MYKILYKYTIYKIGIIKHKKDVSWYIFFTLKLLANEGSLFSEEMCSTCIFSLQDCGY